MAQGEGLERAGGLGVLGGDQANLACESNSSDSMRMQEQLVNSMVRQAVAPCDVGYVHLTK